MQRTLQFLTRGRGLLPVSLSIPLQRSRLCLGTWQGIYLFEHRLHGSERRVVVQVLGG